MSVGRTERSFSGERGPYGTMKCPSQSDPHMRKHLGHYTMRKKSRHALKNHCVHACLYTVYEYSSSSLTSTAPLEDQGSHIFRIIIAYLSQPRRFVRGGRSSPPSIAAPRTSSLLLLSSTLGAVALVLMVWSSNGAAASRMYSGFGSAYKP